MGIVPEVATADNKPHSESPPQEAAATAKDDDEDEADYDTMMNQPQRPDQTRPSHLRSSLVEEEVDMNYDGVDGTLFDYYPNQME